jgi:hypothetical protein
MMLCTSNAVIEREQKRHPIAKTFTLASHEYVLLVLPGFRSLSPTVAASPGVRYNQKLPQKNHFFCR